MKTSELIHRNFCALAKLPCQVWVQRESVAISDDDLFELQAAALLLRSGPKLQLTHEGGKALVRGVPMSKQQYCDWCGVPVDDWDGFRPVVCNDPTCERELAAQERQDALDAADEAYERELGWP